ncbi:helix-turn-helix domain-containing protein [Streptomyces lonarensis]|uniref:Helix-turn-helix domain-containing protein n=1 Tax=Streptomyces lonarensis TaxID=700599 RepID=A0A7X6D4T6_9ACTN|nr:helix-turn-helix transcriptional regulator [Streptomyces lonarensis]NJQ08212.1 helix-turn-helix domain-containing protein [Streptomyces lonarensis]
MPATRSGAPLTARRRLGAELRTLRDRHGLTAEEVAGKLGCHFSKITRVELGQRGCGKSDFDALMEVYSVSGERQAELRDLLVRSTQRLPPWWRTYTDVISANYAEFLAFEAEALTCREHQIHFVPGLAQTAAYARAVTADGIAPLGPDQVDALVEVRMQRQERLAGDDAMRLEMLLMESALRLRVGGARVMVAQLSHLAELVEAENVTLQVVPWSAGARGASTGAFTLFSTDRDRSGDVAFTESAEATTVLRDDPLAVRRLGRLYENLSAVALSVEDSVAMVHRVRKEMMRDA